MAIDNTPQSHYAAGFCHPMFTAFQGTWELGRDSYAGESAIKRRGERYLPPTSGQIEDGYGQGSTQIGQKAYDAYKLRAVYPEIYMDAVEAAVGIMHKKPPSIELPKAMEDMIKKATPLGESLEHLLRKINTRQLITGRLGLLPDFSVKENNQALPYISLYNELSIINWDDSKRYQEDLNLKFVILDESAYELRQDFTWEFINKYRILGMTDGQEGNILSLDSDKTFGYALVDNLEALSLVQLEIPNYQGRDLEKVPFTFINSRDLSSQPDRPPLEGLAHLCLAIYRGEADYRQNLFMQGQDTLVRIGAIGGGGLPEEDSEEVRTGTGARIDVPVGGDAKYIGVNSQGLPEQRQALENDYKRASQKSLQLSDATSRDKESEESLKIRVSGQTATLPQIAKTGAAGLEDSLKNIAVWMGQDPEKVIVSPNLEFTDAEFEGAVLESITRSKMQGAPISRRSIHGYMAEKRITRMTYEEELAEIEKEEPTGDVGGLGGLENEDDIETNAD